MKSQEIPLSKLTPSNSNPRSNVAPGFLKQLKGSIQAVGQTTPILVRSGDNDTFTVVDGNTRLSAMIDLGIEEAHCVIVNGETDIDEREFAVVTNQLRRPLDPWDECEAYLEVIGQGKNIKQAASMFGASIKQVHQRLALASLNTGFKTLWRDGQMGIDALAAATVLSSDLQQRWLEDYDGEYVVDRWHIDAFVSKNTYDIQSAIFPKARIKQVSEADLFSENDYVSDDAAFIKYQNEAIESIIDKTNKEYGDIEFEYYPNTSDMWKTIDEFRHNYKMLTWGNLDSNKPIPEYLTDKERYQDGFDILHIYTDAGMNVRYCIGRHLTDADASSAAKEVVTKDYSGVLLEITREHVRLSLVAYMLTDWKTAHKFLMDKCWYGAKGSSFTEIDPPRDGHTGDADLAQRISHINTSLISTVASDRNGLLIILAARYASCCEWAHIRSFILTLSKANQTKITLGFGPSMYLLGKMKKHMLVSLRQELGIKGEAPSSKKALIEEILPVALKKKWCPNLNEL
tara:strand:- start:622 stop:2166 length:1545 start_codon:yes stop_codon:yes gene_type:complete